MSSLEEQSFSRKDLYDVLGVGIHASSTEIKAAYRNLVKLHHPDAGGDEKKILELNAAWEVLRDSESRLKYDQTLNCSKSLVEEAKKRGYRNARASSAAKAEQVKSAAEDDAVQLWYLKVFVPIDRSLGKIINAFPAELKALSADPYDDSLMESFCNYLETSKKRIDRVNSLYMAMSIPVSIQSFGLSLYHCLSKVEDAIGELDRYTMGYVDNYLHDGREMLREAKRLRRHLQQERSPLMD